MLDYLRCLRPLNLLIVFVTQILFYFIFFYRGYCSTLSLDEQLLPDLVLETLIVPFTLVTVFIAASGYLINDYFDFESDIKNVKLHRLKSKTAYLSLYFLIVFVGFALALAIALNIGHVLLAAIYIIAVAALFLYSLKWKKQVLIGNLVVASFSAFVILILLYAEKDFLGVSNNESAVDTTQLYIYAAFAFLVSMVREIIKDIEDIKGDEAVGYRTLPIVYGIRKAQGVANLFGFALLAMIIYWIYHLTTTGNYLIILIASAILLLLPILFVQKHLLSKANINAEKLSKVCKLHMILGLVVLFINQIIL